MRDLRLQRSSESHRRAFGRWRIAAGILVVAMAARVAPASAQVRVGVHGVRQSEIVNGSFGWGGRAELDLDFLWRGLTLSGTYDHLLPDCDGCSGNEFGAQLLVVPPNLLYLGVGVGYRRFSDIPEDQSGDQTDWGVNLVAGIRVHVIPVIVPFFEVRQEMFAGTLNNQTLSLGVVVSPARARNIPRRRQAR